MSKDLSPCVWLIRHGRSCGQGSSEPPLDDPLAAEGIQQAQTLAAQLPPSLKIDRILVSPLRRALQTAMIVFAGLPAVPLVVLPELREFNHRQTPDKPLWPRHVGTPLAMLRTDPLVTQFNTAPERVQWPTDVTEHWWEPHGGLQDCFVRLQQFLFSVLEPMILDQQLNVVVVAHENVFRVLVGTHAVPNATLFPVHLCRQYHILTPQWALATLQPTNTAVILCPVDVASVAQRLTAALALQDQLCAEKPLLLILLRNSEAFPAAMSMVQANLVARAGRKHDPGDAAEETRSNVLRIVYHIGYMDVPMMLVAAAGRLHGLGVACGTLYLVTHDWHLPVVVGHMEPTNWLRYILLSHPVAWCPSAAPEEDTDAGLALAEHLAAQPDMLQLLKSTCREQLQALGRRTHAWCLCQLAAGAPFGAAVGELVQALRSSNSARVFAILRRHPALAVQPLRSDGAAAIHFAAQAGDGPMLDILLACFGTQQLTSFTLRGETADHFAGTAAIRAALSIWR